MTLCVGIMWEVMLGRRSGGKQSQHVYDGLCGRKGMQGKENYVEAAETLWGIFVRGIRWDKVWY